MQLVEEKPLCKVKGLNFIITAPNTVKSPQPASEPVPSQGQSSTPTINKCRTYKVQMIFFNTVM